ncbi:MAG TPA: ABC transporter ATP-binding protein [Bdellovibrionota bacterium]|jgi:ABC-type multidrug transport system fused ATPase/permease subunit
MSRKFLAEETRFQGRYAHTLRDTIRQAYSPVMVRMLFVLLTGLLGRIVLLGNANLVGYWVDSLCKAPTGCHSPPALFRGYGSRDFLFILVVANVLGFALTLFFRSELARLSAEAVSRIYDETTFRTSRLPMSFFDRNPSGRVMTRFTSDYNSIFRIFGGPIAEFVSITFDLVAMTFLITLASPWLLPFWALQGMLNFAVYRFYLPSLRRERRELSLRRSPAIAHFAESAAGANTIRAFEREPVFEGRFSRLNDAFLEQRRSTVGLFSRFSFAMGSCTAVTFLVTGLASAFLISHGWMGIGAVGVAFAYLALSTNAVQSFFDWLGQFEDAMTGMERMNEYLRLPLEPGAKLPASARFETGQPKEKPEKSKAPLLGVSAKSGATVEIRDLWLRYRDDLPPVLQGVSVNIVAGERVAVVGKTGSGKTSLVQALFRLYPLENGTIKVGGFEAEVGMDLQPKHPFVDLVSYRSLLAYITQEPALFLGSLRENLMAPGAGGKIPVRGAFVHTDEELIEALRRVQFLRDDSTDDEYRYWLGFRVEERGRNLSAGERQLICMARCLLQNAPVVILDEATSAVDPRSEEILTRATEEFFAGKTQILIAHRLSTVRSCDRVIWLQEGRVHRIGKPEEVLPEFEHSELRV